MRKKRLYHAHDRVWLKEFVDEGYPTQPRQKATVIAYERTEIYMVQVDEEWREIGDDGLRELTVDQIEGFI